MTMETHPGDYLIERTGIAAGPLYPDTLLKPIPPYKLQRHFSQGETPEESQIVLSKMLELDERAANGLRGSLIFKNCSSDEDPQRSDFGGRLMRSLEDPGLSHHNHEHSRRVERWLERLLLRSPELYNKPGINSFLSSAMLFPYFHDMDQLINLYEGNKDARAGHPVASAIMLLALAKRYAFERNIDGTEAFRIMRNAAYMVLSHDRNENKSLPPDRHGLAGMRISDLFGCLKTEKIRGGNITDESCESGLDPDFEKEYGEELDVLKSLDESLVLPEDMTPELDDITQTCLLADELDMIAPPMETIFRTLGGIHAQERDFFPSNKSRADFDSIILSGADGPVRFQSDMERKLWEGALVAGRDSDGPYRSRVRREAVLTSFAGLEVIARRIIHGDADMLVSEHYEERKVNIEIKAANRIVQAENQGKRTEVKRIATVRNAKTDVLDKQKEKMTGLMDQKRAYVPNSPPAKRLLQENTHEWILHTVRKLYPGDDSAVREYEEIFRRLDKGEPSGFSPPYSKFDSFPCGSVTNTFRRPLDYIFPEDESTYL